MLQIYFPMKRYVLHSIPYIREIQAKDIIKYIRLPNKRANNLYQYNNYISYKMHTKYTDNTCLHPQRWHLIGF